MFSGDVGPNKKYTENFIWDISGLGWTCKTAATFPMINCPPGNGGLVGSFRGIGPIANIQICFCARCFCNSEFCVRSITPLYWYLDFIDDQLITSLNMQKCAGTELHIHNLLSVVAMIGFCLVGDQPLGWLDSSHWFILTCWVKCTESVKRDRGQWMLQAAPPLWVLERINLIQCVQEYSLAWYVVWKFSIGKARERKAILGSERLQSNLKEKKEIG